MKDSKSAFAMQEDILIELLMLKTVCHYITILKGCALHDKVEEGNR